MKKYYPRDICSIVFLLFALLIFFGVYSVNLQPSHLGFKLSGEAQGQQKIELFYLEKAEAKGIAFRHTQDLNVSTPYYFSYPRHFSPDKVIVDLGVSPSTWVIESVSAHVDFLLFAFDGYRWDMSSLQSLTRPIQSSTVLEFDDEFHVDAVKEPARFVLNLDYSKAQPTMALIVAKLATAVVLLSLVLLFFSKYFWRLFRYRKPDLTSLENSHIFIHTHRKAWLNLGLAILCLVLFVKLFPHFQSPGLHIEDTMEFSDFTTEKVNLFDLKTYDYYRGYRVLISEWLAAAVSNFPVSWQPRLYISLAVSMAIIAVLAAARSGIYSSKLVLTIAPAVLFFGAFTDSAFYITLTGTLFSSTVLLMAIAFRPPPDSIGKFFCYLPLIGVLAMSGPYGSVLLPLSVGLMMLMATRKNILLLGVICLFSIMYIVSAQSGMVQFSNVFNPDIRLVYFRYLTEHVLLLGLFPGVSYLVGLFIVFTTVLLLIVFRRDTLFVKLSLIFLATALASFVTYFLSNKFQQYNGDVISSHTVISQFCWLMFVLMCIDRVANKLTDRFPVGVLSSVVVVVFACAIVAKHRFLAERVELLPAPKFKNYLSALTFARSYSLDDQQFLQLWHVDRLGFITSFRKGNGSVSVPPDELPDFVRPYQLTHDLERQKNTVLIYNRKTRVINASAVNGTMQLPASVDELIPTH